VSKPLNIYQLKTERAALDAMPEDARRIYLLFGHVANEINTLNRLLIFSIKSHEHPVLRAFAEARAATITRFLCGTTTEGYLAVERYILKGKFGQTYLPHISPRGRETLAAVRREPDNTKLIAAIRNNFAFHLPKAEQIDTAYSLLPPDTDLSIYSDRPRHTSMNIMSIVMMTRGMLDCTGQPKGMSDQDAMKMIIDDVLAKSKYLNDFIEHILRTIMERENLSPAEPEVVPSMGKCRWAKFDIPPLLRT
jgi:hypothetical protein